MAVPWLAVGKLVLANLDTILGVVKPAFTRKNVEALPSQTALLNQQISELQAAASGNAEQIRELATQLKQVVGALEQAVSSGEAKRKKLETMCLAAAAISVVSINMVIALAIVR